MITLQDLSFGYKKNVSIFDRVSLELNTGEIVGLLGKNGEGKSTLLRLLSGLHEPREGKLTIDDKIPFERSVDLLQDVFFLPEEFHLPTTSIPHYFRFYGKLYPNFDQEKAARLLKELDVDVKQPLGEMSHGQQKKFMIAFALSTNVKYLFLDEPTNGLDIPSKALFRQVVASSLEGDQTLIVSTHQVKDVESLLDRFLILNEGQFVFNQSVLQVMDKFLFTTVTELNGEPIVYKEQCPGGFHAILPRAEESETEVNIELLFNAIVNQKIPLFSSICDEK